MIRTIPGHFARLQRGKNLYKRITEALKSGKIVMLSTRTKSTQYDHRHVGLFTLGTSGSVYVERGKQRDCIDFSSITIYTPTGASRN